MHAFLLSLLYLSSLNIYANGETALVFSQISGSPDQQVSVQILKKAYRKLGINISFELVSGKRALIQSNMGVTDGEAGRIYEIGEKYPNLIRVPTSVNYIEQSVFTIKDFNIRDCEDLKNLDVGIVRGIKHAEDCTAGSKRVSIVQDSLQLIKELNDRKVDIILAAYFNGMIQIKRLGYSKIKAIRPPLSRKKIYHYLNKKHIALVPKINKALKEMKESGEMKEIRDEVQTEIMMSAEKY